MLCVIVNPKLAFNQGIYFPKNHNFSPSPFFQNDIFVPRTNRGKYIYFPPLVSAFVLILPLKGGSVLFDLDSDPDRGKADPDPTQDPAQT